MIRRFLILAVALLLALPAHAGMIRPDDGERARLKGLLQREEVQVELQKHGILPHEAAARVDAMTPAEVQSLAGRIDAVVAGGQSTQSLLLVIIIVLLIIIAL